MIIYTREKLKIENGYMSFGGAFLWQKFQFGFFQCYIHTEHLNLDLGKNIKFSSYLSLMNTNFFFGKQKVKEDKKAFHLKASCPLANRYEGKGFPQ